ncbi:type II toxin-antitoxin system MqsA family antitoxin [Desulfovibrio psychrotolerans]|uniref:HTH cro/C1-type domain-containing protein n=1 Tax=Desulfovibrio psychrotolerans TaxID=415242 RepID=A0A7J0BX57_9BACT|nr:type II toxin-antitoxin system MqsA family antitoxin [Desulfovibrio psychrotolerans]GFM38287.1 hypothetical protein DSM19430T_29710 [Desulfovibrio psychrotolerans]
MTYESTVCPICEKGTLKKISGFTYKYKNKSLNLPSYIYYECTHCDQNIEAGEDNLDIDAEILNFMRDVDGLLRPEDIKKIRTGYALSQKNLAGILGVGIKTFTRYESGSVTQSRIMDNFLRVLKEHPEILRTLANTPASQFKYNYSMNVAVNISKTDTLSDYTGSYELAECA